MKFKVYGNLFIFTLATLAFWSWLPALYFGVGPFDHSIMKTRIEDVPKQAIITLCKRFTDDFSPITFVSKLSRPDGDSSLWSLLSTKPSKTNRATSFKPLEKALFPFPANKAKQDFGVSTLLNPHNTSNKNAFTFVVQAAPAPISKPAATNKFAFNFPVRKGAKPLNPAELTRTLNALQAINNEEFSLIFKDKREAVQAIAKEEKKTYVRRESILPKDVIAGREFIPFVDPGNSSSFPVFGKHIETRKQEETQIYTKPTNVGPSENEELISQIHKTLSKINSTINEEATVAEIEEEADFDVSYNPPSKFNNPATDVLIGEINSMIEEVEELEENMKTKQKEIVEAIRKKAISTSSKFAASELFFFRDKEYQPSTTPTLTAFSEYHYPELDDLIAKAEMQSNPTETMIDIKEQNKIKMGTPEEVETIEVDVDPTDFYLNPNLVHVILEPVHKATLSSQITSPVIAIEKQMGESFKAGEVLILLDDTIFSANLKKAVAIFKQEKLNAEMRMQLFEDDISSLTELKDAQAKFASAQAELTLARKQLEACVIVAPYSGRVVDLHVQEYELARPNEPLIDIIGDEVLIAKMLVEASELPHFSIGDVINIHFSHLKMTVPAKIIRIGAEIDPASATIRVDARIENPHLTLTAGMTGTAYLPQQKKSSGYRASPSEREEKPGIRHPSIHGPSIQAAPTFSKHDPIEIHYQKMKDRPQKVEVETKFDNK